MEAEGSLPCSQQPAVFPCHDNTLQQCANTVSDTATTHKWTSSTQQIIFPAFIYLYV